MPGDSDLISPSQVNKNAYDSYLEKGIVRTQAQQSEQQNSQDVRVAAVAGDGPGASDGGDPPSGAAPAGPEGHTPLARILALEAALLKWDKD